MKLKPPLLVVVAVLAVSTLLISFFQFVSSSAQATQAGMTYYISNTGSSDTYTGLCETKEATTNCGPWATVAKMEAAIEAGGIQCNDRILLDKTSSWSGSYVIDFTNTPQCNTPQYPGQEIIIGAYGTGSTKPTILVSGSGFYVRHAKLYQGLIIDGLHIKNPSRATAFTIDSYLGVPFSHITVRNSDIEGASSVGLQSHPCSDITFENNLIHEATIGSHDGQGLITECDNFVIRGNTFKNNGETSSSAVYEHAIYLSNATHNTVSTDNILIEGNTFIEEDPNNYASGFIAHGVISNLTIRNNTFTGLFSSVAIKPGDYAYDEYYPNAIVENNVIRNMKNSSIARGLVLSSCVNCTAKNNVFYNNSNGNVINFGESGKRANSGVLIYNNTFYNNASNFYGSTAGTSAKNNIFYSVTGSTIDSNKNFIGNPSFVNPADPLNGGLALAANSPAINTGLTLNTGATSTQVLEDIIGTTRPQGSAWDIGAYEYNDGTPPPTNQVPIVSAFVSPSTITLPTNSTNLIGAIVDDNLPNPPAQTIVTWTKVSGPGTVTFVNPNNPNTVATFSMAGSYTLRLAANDSVLTGYAQVVVNVNPAPIPPSISVHPSGQTVSVGSSATFNVVATSPTPLIYQWRKNGADILGATDSSYTIPATTLNDNGSQFTVRVANSYGSVISNTALLTVTTVPLPSGGLVLDLPFNGNANDQSGNANNGTVAGAILTSDQFGNLDSAYSLTGLNSYISVPDSSSLHIQNAITLAAWVKSDSFYGAHYAVMMMKGSGLYFTLVYNSRNIRIDLKPAKALWDSLVPVPQGVWTHVAVTYDGSNIKLYKNGVFATSTPASGPLDLATNQNDLFIGRSLAAEEPLMGSLDDVKIFNRALSALEIQDLVSPSIAPKLVSAVSRMTHGFAGDFDFALIPGQTNIEPRQNSAKSLKLVLNFDIDVNAQNLQVSSIPISFDKAYNGKSLTLSKSAVPDQTCVTVSLNGVPALSLGTLRADYKPINGVVTNSDITNIRGQVKKPLSTTNFLADVNVDGVINNFDLLAARGSIGNTVSCGLAVSASSNLAAPVAAPQNWWQRFWNWVKGR